MQQHLNLEVLLKHKQTLLELLRQDFAGVINPPDSGLVRIQDRKPGHCDALFQASGISRSTLAATLADIAPDNHPQQIATLVLINYPHIPGSGA